MPESLPVLIGGFLVIFAAGVSQGLTGFGFALVAVPIMVLFMPAKIVPPIVLLQSVLINMVILYKARQWVNIKKIIPLMVAGIAGSPIGTWLLVNLDVSTLKVLIGVVIAISALALLKGFKVEIKNERLAVGPIGFISGILNGAITMSGPPVILFFSNQGVKKEVFRANLVAYFLVLNLGTVPSALIGGVITAPVLTYSLYFLPAMVLGALCGIMLAQRVGEDVFRRIALNTVAAAGLFSVVTGFGIFR